MVINLPKRRTIEHVLRSTMAEYPLSRSTRREMRLWLTGICLALLLLSLWTAGSLPSQPPATRAHLVKSLDLPLVFPVIEENLIPGNMLVEIRSKKTLMEVTPHSPYSIRGQLAYLHRSPPPTRLHFNPDVSPWTPWGPKLETISDYFRYLRTPQTSCRKLKRLGGTYNCKKGQGDENNMDGHKYVCMDPSLEVVGAKDARGCLTLSFGTQMDTSFDKAVSVLPCEVHMFDVLDFDPPLAKFNDNVYFHAEGLARMKYSVHFHNINKTATMDTLKAYFFKNKLYPRPIHILKVDIENGEWEAFKDIAQDPLFDAVGQLAMEVHATELVAGPEGKPPPNVPREKWLGALQERYDVLRMIESTDWDADELLRSVLDGSDMPSGLDNPTLGSLGSLESSVSNLSTTPLTTPTLEAPDDMDSLENLVGLPFHAVLDSGASDSGMSSDSSLDQQLSPLSGYSVSSPGSLGEMGLGMGLASPDPGLDATSDVSSSSDLGSLGSLGCTSPQNSTVLASPYSPEAMLGIDDFIHTDSGFSSPVPQAVPDPVCPPAASVAVTVVSTTPTFITRPILAKVTSVSVPSTVSVVAASSSMSTPVTHVTSVSPPVLKTVTVSAPASTVSTVGGQTIVVTQASKGTTNAHLVRSGTLLKSGQASRSILLPVTVKDLNQVRTIKIISTGGTGGVGGRGVRTVVSTVRTPSTTTTLNSQSIRSAILGAVRSHDTKSLLKGGTTTVLSTARPTTTISSTHTSPTRIKVEPNDDDDDDDDDQPHTAFQQLTLSDEEKRLLKKEGILLPSHYPLTKQEERELKRIRRKIRNKISAQDSRKRKKEYIDGLEDRVKACTEENQQLQKRIRTLEAQNESLLVQMRRFQNVVTGGSNGRSQAHASTALMMLILSAALFIVPSLRQDGATADSELSLPASKMPSAGHSRSLLEAGNGAIVPSTLEVLEGVDDELTSDLDKPLVQALTDHDYTPSAKRQRMLSKSPAYYMPPLDDFPPQHGKPDSGGGFPPDGGSGTKLSARIMDTMVDHVSNNYSDPGGKRDSNSQAVVVNLGQGRKRLRDDLELE